ncbi:MAG: putative acetyltransferase [Acidobacteria bacterium]|nr:putative acetyltransferase [Acidobacteriota bacterium]
MTATIRLAQSGDMPAVGQLGATLMRTHYDFDRQRFIAPFEGVEEGYASFLQSILQSPDNVIFVAEDGGAVVAYVWAALEPLSWKELRGPAGFIHDLVVAEEWRRHGIARRLMDAAIEWLREKNAPRVVLWTAAPNDIAQALFESLGFRDTMIEMTLELPR